MKIEMYDEGPAITVDDLSNLEQQVTKKLPDSLKQLLLKHNGGHPYPSKFKVQWKDQDWADGYNVGSFGDFYSINEDDEVGDFFEHFQSFEGRIPASTLAIAHLSGGDLLLIGVDDDNKGKIYYWAHSFETDDDDEPDYSNVGFVADDLNQLFEILYDDEA